MALAAFLFLWQLGSSSFFIDEAASMRLAALPLGDLLPRLRVAENSPGAYFALLHVWTNGFDSRAEWVARLPSALAAIALVLATWRLALLVAGERAAAIAALLVAVSPLVLQYAQQARTYTIAMLVVVVAATAAIEAARRKSWKWAVAGALACVLAISLQYATLAIVAVLCVWFATRRELEVRMRVLFCALPALAFAAWVPLALEQREHHPDADLGAFGTLSLDHAVRVIGAPVDVRYATEVGVVIAAGAAVFAAVIAYTLVRVRRGGEPELRLLLALVLVPLVALFGAAAIGVDILNSRYMTFGVPFLLIMVGAVLARAALPVAVAALGVVLAAAIIGNVRSHRPEGFYPDSRGVVATIDRGWRPGDVVLDEATFGVHYPLVYYAEERLPKGAPVLYVAEPAARIALSKRPRLWVVNAGSRVSLPAGYRSLGQRRFEGSVDITLALAEPRS